MSNGFRAVRTKVGENSLATRGMISHLDGFFPPKKH